MTASRDFKWLRGDYIEWIILLEFFKRTCNALPQYFIQGQCLFRRFAYNRKFGETISLYKTLRGLSIKVLYYLGTEAKWKMAPENVKNMLKYGKENTTPFEIEVVANGIAVMGLLQHAAEKSNGIWRWTNYPGRRSFLRLVTTL